MLSVDTLIPAPADYAAARVGSGEYPIPPYAKYLAGVKICLNPGHGGDARKRAFKRGPSGVREAEMNLRVAKYLRSFLERVGAVVLVTREDDVELSYEQRARIATDWGADLFVSIHHNAIDNKPQVNYTTVWYHADVDYRPSNLDLARYLNGGLQERLALPQYATVPLKSDQLMYENGFAVLLNATVTAALSESAFYTNPDEEQRLRQPAYNLREAHGLFLGLARYAAAGLPRAALMTPAGGIARAGETLIFELDDGLRGRKAWGHERTMILRDSIAVRISGRPAAYEFVDDGERYELRVRLPSDLDPGAYHVALQFQNMNKNSVLNPNFEIDVR